MTEAKLSEWHALHKIQDLEYEESLNVDIAKEKEKKRQEVITFDSLKLVTNILCTL